MIKRKTCCFLFCGLLFTLLLLLTLHHNVQNRWYSFINPAFLKHQPLLTAKPQRIISMSPSNTEILYALGAGDRVVGVPTYSDFPEEAKSKPSIGGYHAPDIEKIISLSPDIVVANGTIQTKYIRILEQMNIRVVSVEPKTMPEILAAIDIISEAIGEQERGQTLHAALAEQLNAVQHLTAHSPPKRVFVEVWDAPLMTVGNQSFINDMINQAGGINVAADHNVDYMPCDIETLYNYNPEVYIIISHNRDDMRSLITKADLADITAVKNKQIFPMVDDLFVRPGPRSFTGLMKLAEILHPEAMNNR